MTSSTGLGSTFHTSLTIGTLALGIFVSLATLLAFLGSVWWGFDFVANFRWQLAWIALACAIVYSLTAKGIASFLFVAAVIINGFTLAPLWTGSQPIGTGENGVRVVYLDLTDTTDSQQALRWLFDSDADLIIVSGTTSDHVEPLVAVGSPYVPIIVPEHQRTGVSIIGKQPYAIETLTAETTAEPVYVISVQSGDKVIKIVTAWGELASNSVKADALTARLDTVRSVVDGRTGPVMVVGDLGATRFAHGIRTMLGDTALRDATEGSGYLSTWPTSGLPVVGGWIGIPIDILLMTPDITPFDFETGPDVGADHLPLTTVVGLTLGS